MKQYSITIKKVYITVILVFVSSLSMWSQKRTDASGLTLTIRPFYSDYVATMDEIPDKTWSANPYLHCQFIETIPSSYITKGDTFSMDNNYAIMNSYGWTQSIGGLFLLPYIQAEYPKVFNIKTFPAAPPIQWKNNKEDSNMAVLRYTYLPPFQIKMSDYYAPTYFLISDELPYFFSRSNKTPDSLHITIDASDALFYVRSDNSFVVDPIDPALKRFKCTTSSAPSIFIMYRPAFLRETGIINGIEVDILLQHLNIGQHVSSEGHCKMSIQPMDDRAPIDSALNRLHKILPSLCELTNALPHSAPKKIDLIVTNTNQKWDDWGYSIGRAFIRHDNIIVLVDPQDYYSRILTHELTHIFFPYLEAPLASWLSSFDRYLLNEAFVEYIACVIQERNIGDSYWKDKSDFIVEQKIDLAKAKKIAQINGVTYNGQDSQSSYWLYYMYIPYLIHQKALEREGDWDMASHIVSIYKQGIDSNWEKDVMEPILRKFKDELGIDF